MNGLFSPPGASWPMSGAPLPGMELSGASGANAEDPHTPELIPGESLKATVQLAAPADFAGGKLTLQAYPGWKIEPASIEIPALKGGAITAYTFTVATPADSRFFRFSDAHDKAGRRLQRQQ